MRRTAYVVLCLLALSGCASVSTTPMDDSASLAAIQLQQQGKYGEAAQAWSNLAGSSRGLRDRALLHAADAWWLDGQTEAARTAWAQVKPRRLQGSDGFLFNLLGAELAAATTPVSANLMQLSRNDVAAELRERWHRLRLRQFERNGDGFASAGERAWLAESARGRDARNVLTREIESDLAGVDDATLARASAALAKGHPLYPYAGRALTRRGLPLPRPYERAVARDDQTIPAAERDGYRPPLRVAVLVPLSGPLAQAGQSVRDGVLAAYFAEGRRRPTLSFHDTAGGLDKALAAAQKRGAQLLIGPITRDEVTSLFEGKLSTNRPADLPVLALNRSPGPPPPGSASFALAPEDEGAAVAERLASRGIRRVLAITQDDDNAHRALASFREHLKVLGGEVVGEVRVVETNPDYLPALQRALAQAGAEPPEAVFLTLKAAPARLLAAQLELVGLAGLPRVATSLILAGGNARMDSELEGIQYPELPWLLGLRSDLPDPEQLARRLPTAQGGGARLFAFGMDAWRLAAYLDHLSRNPDAVIRGASGELQLDGFGTVSRAPAWAVFRGGRPHSAPDGALLPDAQAAD